MSNTFPSPILMVLLSEPLSISGDDLQTHLREKLNPGITLVGEGNSEAGFLITWNDTTYAVMRIDKPIPSDTFATALKTSHGLPQGERLVADHKAHLIISPMNGADHQLSAIFGALGIMTLADLIAEKASPMAFYWSNSEVLADNKQFADHVKKAAEAIGAFNKKVPNALYGLPATLWAGLRFFSSNQQNKVGAITKGLDALTGFEIQIDPFESKPAEIAKHLFGMVAYVLANGSVFKEGDTIGIEKDKNFRMKWVPAKDGMPARWVMKLETT